MRQKLLGYCCDRKARAACAQSFTLWQQATIETTRQDHSSSTPVITFNHSHVSMGELPRHDHSIGITLSLLVRTTYIWVLFFALIPFVVNHTFSATPAERLQQYKQILAISSGDKKKV